MIRIISVHLCALTFIFICRVENFVISNHSNGRIERKFLLLYDIKCHQMKLIVNGYKKTLFFFDLIFSRDFHSVKTICFYRYLDNFFFLFDLNIARDMFTVGVYSFTRSNANVKTITMEHRQSNFSNLNTPLIIKRIKRLLSSQLR